MDYQVFSDCRLLLCSDRTVGGCTWMVLEVAGTYFGFIVGVWLPSGRVALWEGFRDDVLVYVVIHSGNG